MSKLAIRNICNVLAIIVMVLITCIGCVTVWEYPLPSASQRTKSAITKTWGEPTKIFTDPKKLKYGADEVWIYKNPEPGHPSLTEERLYFKGDILIKREGITLDSF